jgi:hypothetical protein
MNSRRSAFFLVLVAQPVLGKEKGSGRVALIFFFKQLSACLLAVSILFFCLYSLQQRKGIVEKFSRG